MASLTSISGIASGIDFPALVDQIVALERRPIDRLQASIDQGTKRKAAIESFRMALGGLKSSLAALKDGSALGARTTNVAGTDAFVTMPS